MSATVYWRNPFTPVCNPKQLLEYIVMDIEIIKEKVCILDNHSSTFTVICNITGFLISYLQKGFSKKDTYSILTGNDSTVTFYYAKTKTSK